MWSQNVYRCSSVAMENDPSIGSGKTARVRATSRWRHIWLSTSTITRDKRAAVASKPHQQSASSACRFCLNVINSTELSTLFVGTCQVAWLNLRHRNCLVDVGGRCQCHQRIASHLHARSISQSTSFQLRSCDALFNRIWTKVGNISNAPAFQGWGVENIANFTLFHMIITSVWRTAGAWRHHVSGSRIDLTAWLTWWPRHIDIIGLKWDQTYLQLIQSTAEYVQLI